MIQQPSQPQTATDPAQAQAMARIAAQLTLKRSLKSGANNFYWVAALSVINSVVALFNGGLFFVIGLGATLFIDAVASGVADEFGRSPVVLGIGLVFSLFIAGIFALCGFFANKAKSWAFIAGMILYGLDGLLMLVFQEWFGFGFHLLILWGMWGGFQALRKLNSINTAQVSYAVPPAETMR